ncbi:uncharacterized protein G2W53_000947 [Senna tora]|uniref:Uncharacterized protein n=1 Tax=Senna tora TaxID=362788 RepID=A0A834XGV3_9FABA|nr:uncharacterized protein G2W53_000947 [Senna tora]
MSQTIVSSTYSSSSSSLGPPTLFTLLRIASTSGVGVSSAFFSGFTSSYLDWRFSICIFIQSPLCDLHPVPMWVQVLQLAATMARGFALQGGGELWSSRITSTPLAGTICLEV